MRSFRDELVESGFEVIYKTIEEDDFKTSYTEKLNKLTDEINIDSVSIYEIEDKPFEKTFLSKLNKNVKLNYLSSPMFLTSRANLKIIYLVQKNLSWQIFINYKGKKIIF